MLCPESVFFPAAQEGKVENLSTTDKEVTQYKTDESVNDAIDEVDQKLATLEHRIVQKIMELSEEIKELKEENRKLWAFVKKNRKILEELEREIDAENWVSEELRAEAYARSEQRYRDFGFWAVRA